jgi:hypothetical protein
MIIAMIRCWSVLLPLKMVTGFEDAVSSLERRALGPLHLEARVNPRTRYSAPETVKREMHVIVDWCTEEFAKWSGYEVAIVARVSVCSGVDGTS